MPRKRKSQYPQRSDMQNQVPTGLPYGQAGQLEQAQAAVPLQAEAAPTYQMGQIEQAAQNFTFPQIDLYGPTQRPGEPVQAGLPLGPGVGPEALASGRKTGSSHLQRAAMASGNPVLIALAEQARKLGF